MGQLLQSDRNLKRSKDLAENGTVPQPVPADCLVGHLQPGDILTPKQLAKCLQVPVSWVYKQSARPGPDSLPVLRCGMYLRFSWPDVCEWLRSKT